MKDRIKQLMESKRLSQQSFAETLNISPASLSSIFKNRTKPTLNHVDAIRARFPEVSLSWLLYGEGPMIAADAGAATSGTAPSAEETQEPMLDFDSASLPSDSPAATTPSAALLKKKVSAIEPVVKYVDRPRRQISEIRIFYDDQTWETFVPKNK